MENIAGVTVEKQFFKRVAGFFGSENRKMVNFIKKRIADESYRDAEDILQDVMLKVMDMADLNLPLEKLSSYIYTALRNKVIDALRTRKQNISLDEPGAVDELALKGLINEGLRADSDMEQKEYYSQIYKAIDELNDEEKAIVIVTDFEGLTFREIAEEWDVPIGTLLSRKKRALDKIKNILTKGGVENAQR